MTAADKEAMSRDSAQTLLDKPIDEILEDVEGDSGAKESRVFDDNAVTGFEHHLGDKVKTLLGTVKYKDVVGGARGAVVPHALSDLGAQLRNAI